MDSCLGYLNNHIRMNKLEAFSTFIMVLIFVAPLIVAAYMVALPMGLAATFTVIFGIIAKATT